MRVFFRIIVFLIGSQTQAGDQAIVLSCVSTDGCFGNGDCTNRPAKFLLNVINDGEMIFVKTGGTFIKASADPVSGFFSWGDDWKPDAVRLFGLANEFQWIWFDYKDVSGVEEFFPMMTLGVCEEIN